MTPPSNLETVVEELPEARPLNDKSEPIFIVLLVLNRSPVYCTAQSPHLRLWGKETVAIELVSPLRMSSSCYCNVHF